MVSGKGMCPGVGELRQNCGNCEMQVGWKSGGAIGRTEW